jgi:hypothetical protein
MTDKPLEERLKKKMEELEKRGKHEVDSQSALDAMYAIFDNNLSRPVNGEEHAKFQECYLEFTFRNDDKALRVGLDEKILKRFSHDSRLFEREMDSLGQQEAFSPGNIRKRLESFRSYDYLIKDSGAKRAVKRGLRNLVKMYSAYEKILDLPPEEYSRELMKIKLGYFRRAGRFLKQKAEDFFDYCSSDKERFARQATLVGIPVVTAGYCAVLSQIVDTKQFIAGALGAGLGAVSGPVGGLISHDKLELPGEYSALSAAKDAGLGLIVGSISAIYSTNTMDFSALFGDYQHIGLGIFLGLTCGVGTAFSNYVNKRRSQ